MGKKRQNKFNERSSLAHTRELKNVEDRQGKKEPLIVFSFRYFDRNQGQSFDAWEDEKILAKAMHKIHEICNLTRQQAVNQSIIKEYGKGVFPSKSDFTHPKHIPDDISWCSLHIQGKECVLDTLKAIFSTSSFSTKTTDSG
jgi:hypothetical protein